MSDIVHNYGEELPVRADIMAEIVEDLGYRLHLDLSNGRYVVVEATISTPDVQQGLDLDPAPQRGIPQDDPFKEDLRIDTPFPARGGGL